MSRTQSSKVALLPWLLFPAFLASCGGEGGGSLGGGGGAGDVDTLDVFVTDAPGDELLSFALAIDELRLVGASGAGANLLAGSVPLELLGLNGSQHWLVRENSLPIGIFTSIELTIAQNSVSAKDKLGEEVAVTVLSGTLVAPFTTPLVLDGSGDVQVLVDFDLASSISGGVSTPPLLFDPQGTADIQNGSSKVAIDEIRGVVQSADEATSSLVIGAFADDDLAVPLASVTIQLSDSTGLVDDSGLPIASLFGFFGILVPGSTLLEVHGALQDQAVAATLVEIEDHQGGQGTEDLVKIEGLVTNLDATSQSFDLLIIEIEKGVAIAGPVLVNLGNPTSIPVQWTAGTLFFLDDSLSGSSDSLSEGTRIKAKFAVFATTPFLANRIELEEGPDFEGTIVESSGLPTSVIIHLDEDELAILSGQVDGSNTPVVVDLSKSSLFLDTHQEPVLAKTQLLVGLKIEAQEATLSGPSSGPTLMPQKTKVFAGRFRGSVASVAPGVPSFNATMDELKDSFGASVSFGPVTVEIAANCTFEDDAASQAQFFALFEGLAEGESLEVEVFGLGTGIENEILAYEIEVKIE